MGPDPRLRAGVFAFVTILAVLAAGVGPERAVPGFQASDSGTHPLSLEPVPLDVRPREIATPPATQVNRVSENTANTDARPAPGPLDAPFGGDVQVASGLQFQTRPTIATASNGSWILVAYVNESGGNRNVYSARSTDGGLTWTHTPVAASNSFDEFDPRLAVHGPRIFLFFGQEDPTLARGFRFAVSADEGVTWTVSQVDYGASAPFRDLRTPDASSDGTFLYAVYGLFCDIPNACGSTLAYSLLTVMFDANGQIVTPSIYFPFGIDIVDPAIYVGPVKTMWAADIDASAPSLGGAPGTHDVVWMPTATGQNNLRSWQQAYITGAFSSDVVRVDAGGWGPDYVFPYQYLNASAGFSSSALVALRTDDTGVNYTVGVVASGQGIPFKDPAIVGSGSILHATFFMGGDLGYLQSSDGGASWSSPVTVNVNRGTVLDAVRAGDVTYAGKVRVTWADDRAGDADIFYSDADGLGAPDLAPRAAPVLDAELGGPGFSEVLMSWGLSPDDGAGEADVDSYLLYESTAFDRQGAGYQLVATLAAGTATYTATGQGVGDAQTRFYRLVVRDAAGHETASEEQFVKYHRHLGTGAHLLSVPVAMSDTSVEKVLRGVDYSLARTYVNNAGQGNNWLTKAKDKPWGDLSTIDETIALWLLVAADSDLVVAGLVRSATTVHLAVGWNFVGYSSFAPRTVQQALAGASVQTVEGFDPGNPPFYLRRLAPTDVLQPGDGLWVHVSEPFDWVQT